MVKGGTDVFKNNVSGRGRGVGTRGQGCTQNQGKWIGCRVVFGNREVVQGVGLYLGTGRVGGQEVGCKVVFRNRAGGQGVGCKVVFRNRVGGQG